MSNSDFTFHVRNPQTGDFVDILEEAIKPITVEQDDVRYVDGSKVRGILPIEAIPHAALERLVNFASLDDARANFNSEEPSFQLGDTIRIPLGDGLYQLYYAYEDEAGDIQFAEYSAGNVFTYNTMGYVPGPTEQEGEENRFLKADGSWSDINANFGGYRWIAKSDGGVSFQWVGGVE